MRSRVTPSNITTRARAIVTSCLTVVRMVPVAIATLETRPGPATVAYQGRFGPRGLASIVFAVLVVEADLPQGGDDRRCHHDDCDRPDSAARPHRPPADRALRTLAAPRGTSRRDRGRRDDGARSGRDRSPAAGTEPVRSPAPVPRRGSRSRAPRRARLSRPQGHAPESPWPCREAGTTARAGRVGSNPRR